MNIVEATRRFESWLRRQIDVVEADLDYKHEQMRLAPFPYFRATFYRWVQLWKEHCPKLADADEVLTVGDLHIENFGTWRDAEGRLAWGVNDFDEAHPMAFANDLARLAVSAALAADQSSNFKLKPKEICEQLEDGYRHSLDEDGLPFVLMESHPELRKMAIQDLRQPIPFWNRLEAKLIPPADAVPSSAQKAIRKMLPGGIKPAIHVLNQPKGLGSLGRQRFTVTATWQGGKIAREAKSVVPSAVVWAANQRAGKGNPWLMKTVRAAIRCEDPFYDVRRGWLVRRLAPDCSRIDIEELVQHEDMASLLRCMGRETANIHLGTSKARKRIRTALKHLPKRWLLDSTLKLHRATLKDFDAFKKAGKKKLAAK
jgi:hypothetical protein